MALRYCQSTLRLLLLLAQLDPRRAKHLQPQPWPLLAVRQTRRRQPRRPVVQLGLRGRSARAGAPASAENLKALLATTHMLRLVLLFSRFCSLCLWWCRRTSSSSAAPAFSSPTSRNVQEVMPRPRRDGSQILNRVRRRKRRSCPRAGRCCSSLPCRIYEGSRSRC